MENSESAMVSHQEQQQQHQHNDNDSVQQKTKKKSKNKRQISKTTAETNGADSPMNGISESVKENMHITAEVGGSPLLLLPLTDRAAAADHRQWNAHEGASDGGGASLKVNGVSAMQWMEQVPTHKTTQNGHHPPEHTSVDHDTVPSAEGGVELNGGCCAGESSSAISNNKKSRSKSNKSKNKLEQEENSPARHSPFSESDGAHAQEVEKVEETTGTRIRAHSTETSTLDKRAAAVTTSLTKTSDTGVDKHDNNNDDDDDDDGICSSPASITRTVAAISCTPATNNNKATDKSAKTATATTTSPIAGATAAGSIEASSATAIETTATDDTDPQTDAVTVVSPELDLSNVHIEYKEYESELQMHDIMRLIQAELSEPYSIYTYRYFIYNWPKLCFLAAHGNEYVGAIVCKLDMHMSVRRGYIAMLAVRKEYRKLRIGTTLVQKAIEAMLSDNADEVVLETEMRNLPALRLYENLGFVRDKRLFRYYLNGVDALRLKLWFR